MRGMLRESHRPECAAVFRAAQDPPLCQQASAVLADRPSILFGFPRPAEVITLLPDGPIHRLSWQGGEHTVTACLGPERLAPEWWQGGAAERDYFAVQAEHGLWLWVCRDTGGARARWGVHGVWA
jgi:protein ImuB